MFSKFITFTLTFTFNFNILNLILFLLFKIYLNIFLFIQYFTALFLQCILFIGYSEFTWRFRQIDVICFPVQLVHFSLHYGLERFGLGIIGVLPLEIHQYLLY